VKTYRVVGTSTVAVSGSHPPGSVFCVDMPASTEAFLTQIGAIVEVVVPRDPDPEPAPVPEPAVEVDHGAAAPDIHSELDFGDDEKEEG